MFRNLQTGALSFRWNLLERILKGRSANLLNDFIFGRRLTWKFWRLLRSGYRVCVCFDCPRSESFIWLHLTIRNLLKIGRLLAKNYPTWMLAWASVRQIQHCCCYTICVRSAESSSMAHKPRRLSSSIQHTILFHWKWEDRRGSDKQVMSHSEMVQFLCADF